MAKAIKNLSTGAETNQCPKITMCIKRINLKQVCQIYQIYSNLKHMYLRKKSLKLVYLEFQFDKKVVILFQVQEVPVADLDLEPVVKTPILGIAN